LVVSYDTVHDFHKVIAVRNRNILLPEDEHRRDEDLNILNALLGKLHRHEKWPFLIYGPTDGSIQKEQDKHGGYIMLFKAVKVVKQIRNQLIKLKTSTGWNSRAYFVIVVMDYSNYFRGSLLEDDILAEFWSEKIANTIVLLPTHSNTHLHNWMEGTENKELTTLLEVYTLFPYQPRHCDDVMHASLVDHWVKIDSTKGRFIRNVPLFPHKIPQDLHGYTISVSTFDSDPLITNKESVYNDGLEIRLLNIILKYMNLNVMFVKPLKPNGSWDGIIGHVAHRRTDVAIGGLIVYNVSTESFDVTVSYLEQGISWYVPCANTRPRWKSITMVFSASVWLRILFFYVSVSTVAWYLYKKHWKSSEFFQDTPHTFLIILLKLWAVLLGMSASCRIPNSATFRILFIVWTFYSLALNTVYQIFLTTYLVDPGLEEQITTEDQLLLSGIELGVSPFFEEVYNEIFRSQQNKIIHCPNIEHCLQRLARKRDLAVLCPKFLAKYMGKFKFFDSNGNPGYCHLEEQFGSVSVAMYMQKGHPLLYHFNKIILRVTEGGLIYHWSTDMYYKATLSFKNISGTSITSEFQKFSIYHLQSSFYALGFGYFLSVSVFLCELITQYYKKE
jgi:hypothetical protein